MKDPFRSLESVEKFPVGALIPSSKERALLSERVPLPWKSVHITARHRCWKEPQIAIFENRIHGRLITEDPQDKSFEVLVAGLSRGLDPVLLGPFILEVDGLKRNSGAEPTTPFSDPDTQITPQGKLFWKNCRRDWYLFVARDSKSSTRWVEN